MAKTIKDLPIGSKIKFGKYQVESDTPESIIWTKLDDNHYKDSNNPSILDHVTLLTEKIIDLRAFDAMETSNPSSDRSKYGNNRYSVSNIRQWLNSEKENWFVKQHEYDEPPANLYIKYNTGYYDNKGFLNGFTQYELKNIIHTNLIVAKNRETDGNGSEIVTDKIFLLSRTEVGLGNENNIVEGDKLEIFNTSDSRLTPLTKQTVNNTKSMNKPVSEKINWNWMLRTPNFVCSNLVRCVSLIGILDDNDAYSGNPGIRPALNLKSDIMVSENLDSDGCYILMYNQAPEISGSDSDLGNKTESFIISYSVNDVDSYDSLTVQVKLDNTRVSYFSNATRNQEYKINLNSKFNDLSLGKHTISIEVLDGQATTTRTYTFTKIADKIIFSIKPVETSREARKISLTAILSKEESDILTVYCCNNAFDKVPTWEDCTEEYINKLPYFFKNKERTANKWGLSIKFDLRK